MREERCCICPNGYSKNKATLSVCPGIPGTKHPRKTRCDFVNVWRDRNGHTIFVAGLVKGYFVSFRRYAGGGFRRAAAQSLPARKTFDDAQTDLNLYAQKKGWKLG